MPIVSLQLAHRPFGHDRHFASQADTRNAQQMRRQDRNILGNLAFMRETIPQEWTKFRDKVSDNFRVITQENFRVLK